MRLIWMVVVGVLTLVDSLVISEEISNVCKIDVGA